MTERMSGAENRARRQQEQAAGFDAIGSRYDEVFPHKRVYDPPTPDVPPEIQLFLLAKRT
jgi:hypothetical protein